MEGTSLRRAVEGVQERGPVAIAAQIRKIEGEMLREHPDANTEIQRVERGEGEGIVHSAPQ